MWAFARTSDVVRAAALAFGLGAAGMAGAEAPARVVSLNLCTDQLALMLAPDLVVSVSSLAADPVSSALHEDAAGVPANRARAEEVFLLDTDLVLAGIWSEAETVAILRRLGLRVETFPPATTLDDLRGQILRMGALLGREAAAEALVADFDARLAALRRDPPDTTAVVYYANGFAGSDTSLAGEALRVAGIRNLAAEAGFGGARLPLERLVTMAPDLIVTGTRYPGTSRSEAILDHPALRRAIDARPVVVVPDREWICGTPAFLDAVARLASAAEALR
ncbi:ABC transporter substrate-binding protein [Palleronia sp. KMU-117]|uniref:ABC transporter substrate-binding protein n=1 Tax=Palleronia sp. KMU-117 TaxID=3434108 RepID=UPI003D713346